MGRSLHANGTPIKIARRRRFSYRRTGVHATLHQRKCFYRRMQHERAI